MFSEQGQGKNKQMFVINKSTECYMSTEQAVYRLAIQLGVTREQYS